jgi:hypothetical protein
VAEEGRAGLVRLRTQVPVRAVEAGDPKKINQSAKNANEREEE